MLSSGYKSDLFYSVLAHISGVLHCDLLQHSSSISQRLGKIFIPCPAFIKCWVELTTNHKGFPKVRGAFMAFYNNM